MGATKGGSLHSDHSLKTIILKWSYIRTLLEYGGNRTPVVFFCPYRPDGDFKFLQRFDKWPWMSPFLRPERHKGRGFHPAVPSKPKRAAIPLGALFGFCCRR
jgi:hypothetical protein